jgi:predicted secreted hydrolase
MDLKETMEKVKQDDEALIKVRNIYNVMVLTVMLAIIILSQACSDGSTSVTLDDETLENVAYVLWMSEYDSAAIPADVAASLRSEKNSALAFGERMRTRLDELMDNPESFTPDYMKLYETISAYATTLTPHQAYTINTMLGLDSVRDYREIPPEITFTFPMDDRPQFEYQVGWHFFVGSVFTETGDEYGVQLMFWRCSLLPPLLAESLGLSDIENQIVEIHFAISPAGDRHYRAKPYIVAGTTGLVSFSSNPFNYQIGKNFMRSSETESLFPLQLQAWGIDNTQGSPVELKIDLTLNQTKGYVLNGDQGLAPSCGGVGTLYYSVPNLQIDPAKSRLRVNGKESYLAHGKFWYDHQWGTGFMPAGSPRSDVLRAATNLSSGNPGGWEWMAIQFDDNTEMGLSALHSNENSEFYGQTGPTPPGTMTAPANGVYIDATGDYAPVSGQIKVTEWIQSAIVHDQYMATNIWYPNKVEVTLNTDTVPENRRRFTMIPIVDTGQQGFFAGGLQYSEGAVYIETPEGERIGRGFLESTGYANNKIQRLRLSGLPETEEMIQLMPPVAVTPELFEQSAGFLLDPENEARLSEELSACKGLPDTP